MIRQRSVAKWTVKVKRIKFEIRLTWNHDLTQTVGTSCYQTFQVATTSEQEWRYRKVPIKLSEPKTFGQLVPSSIEGQSEFSNPFAWSGITFVILLLYRTTVSLPSKLTVIRRPPVVLGPDWIGIQLYRYTASHFYINFSPGIAKNDLYSYYICL